MASGAQYPGAIWTPSPHFFVGSGGQRRAWIIVHGTAGGSSAQEVAGWFQGPQGGNPTSVHYVIGQDGVIVQCVSEANSAWGNGRLTNGHASFWNAAINPNLQTFSIEHVKPDVSNVTPITAAQQKSSFALIAYLCAKYQIPHHSADKTGGITGHFSIDPVKRSFCPGSYPWAALFTYLGSPGAAISLPTKNGKAPIPPVTGVGSPASTDTTPPTTTTISGPTLATVAGVQNALASQISSVARAPLSKGFLGVVEQIDEWEMLPEFTAEVVVGGPGSWVPFGITWAEAAGFRLLIALVGVLIILACIFNVAKSQVENNLQVAAPLLRGAVGV